MAKTGYTILIIAVVAVLVIGGIILVMNNNQNLAGQSVNTPPAQNSTVSQTPATNVPSSTPMSSSTGNTDSVTIQSFAFSPQNLTINVGDTVTWTNLDSVAHTVTSNTGSELNSSNLSQGQSYSHTFTTAGT
jgi:plastocyanin